MPPRKKDENGKEQLTVREQRFVEFVAQGKSYTEAAIEAGYSERWAEEIGKQNYRKLPIQQAVQERIQGIKASTDEIHFLLAMHLRGDIGDLEDCLNDDGDFSLRRAKKLGLSRLIKKFKPRTVRRVDKDGSETVEKTVDIELYSAQEAAKVLADIQGLKQAPKVNEADVEREREKFEELVRRRIAEGWTEQQAKQIVLEACPDAAQWIH